MFLKTHFNKYKDLEVKLIPMIIFHSYKMKVKPNSHYQIINGKKVTKYKAFLSNF